MKQITMTHKRRANKISFLTDTIDTKFSRKNYKSNDGMVVAKCKSKT